MDGLVEVQVCHRVATRRLPWLGPTTGAVATKTVARATSPVEVRASTTPCPVEMPTMLPSDPMVATVALNEVQVIGIAAAGDPSACRKLTLSRASSDGSK